MLMHMYCPAFPPRCDAWGVGRGPCPLLCLRHSAGPPAGGCAASGTTKEDGGWRWGTRAPPLEVRHRASGAGALVSGPGWVWWQS